MPYTAVRHFSSWFFRLKCDLLAFEIKRSKSHPARWEKKGSTLYTPRNIKKYHELKKATNRLLNKINNLGGFVYFNGIEKSASISEHNAKNLYLSVLRNTVQRLDRFGSGKHYLSIVMDEHDERRDLVRTASQEMYGKNTGRSILEPPYQVESELYQTCQCADWICGLLNRIHCYRFFPDQFADYGIIDQYFGDRLHKVAKHSGIRKA